MSSLCKVKMSSWQAPPWRGARGLVLCEPRARAVSATPAKTAVWRKPGGRYHDWNENFDLHKAPPIWVASQASGTRKDSEW